MKNKKHIYLYFLIFWTIVILTLLFAPSSAFSHEPKLLCFPGMDKVVHFILFSVFSFLLYKLVQIKKRYNHKIISELILCVVTLFGLITEVAQGLTFNILKRTFSLFDLLTDVSACIVVILIFYFKDKNNKK